MRVECEVSATTVIMGDRPREGVCVACTRCGHEVEVAGTSERSVRRGLATLRDECPKDETNFYVTEDDDTDG